jgi:hypothetical protein
MKAIQMWPSSPIKTKKHLELHNCFTVLENTDTASHRVCEAEDNVDWEEDDSIYVEPKCRDKQRSSPFEGLILQFPLVAHPIKRLNKAAYLVCVMCASNMATTTEYIIT